MSIRKPHANASELFHNVLYIMGSRVGDELRHATS